jgi:transcriptional regulator with XRE-family HTH domain
MASIGQELKRERELRGISLKEIADSTKINIRFLRALEEDRFDMLPEKFFIRGIIRAYASYIGLDEQSVLNTYLEGLQAREKQQGSEEDKRTEAIEDDESHPDKKKNIFFFTLTVLVILALTVILYVVFQKDEEPLPSSAEIQSLPAKPQEKSLTLPPITEEKPEIKPEDLALEILVQQETWIEVFADQEMLDSGIKYPGDRLHYKARKEFLIHIGNAGGVAITINGQEGIRLGEPGAVRRDISITLDNYQDFIAQEIES